MKLDHTSSDIMEDIFKSAQYNSDLTSAIQGVFLHYVVPGKVRHLFKNYSSRVLVKLDEERVMAVTESKGDSEGALELLRRLCRYENWFDCLISVLEDQDVKLDHVADDMRRRRADVAALNSRKKANRILKCPIITIFQEYIIPGNVIHFIHTYDHQVLKKKDLEKIQTVTEREGYARGSMELLKQLQKYDNWFSCLNKVLRDENVKLQHVAEMLENKSLLPQGSVNYTTLRKLHLDTFLGKQDEQSPESKSRIMTARNYVSSIYSKSKYIPKIHRTTAILF